MMMRMTSKKRKERAQEKPLVADYHPYPSLQGTYFLQFEAWTQAVTPSSKL
jgi:hypothetical protein